MPPHAVPPKEYYLGGAQSCLFEGLPQASYPLVYKLLQPIHLISLHVGMEHPSPQLTETPLSNIEVHSGLRA